MRELIARGIPVVFISHNLPAVLELCTRAIVVDHGTVKFDGDPAAAIQEYRLVPWTKADRKDSAATTSPIRIARTELQNDRAEPSAVFQTGGALRIRVKYDAAAPVQNASFAVDIHRGDGVYCAGINTMMDKRDLGVLSGTGHVDLVIPRLNLLPGCYLVSVGIMDSMVGRTYDLHNRAYPFSMMSDRRDLGLVYLERDWAHQTHAPMETAERTLVTSGTERH
jgi:hypothetical protein